MIFAPFGIQAHYWMSVSTENAFGCVPPVQVLGSIQLSYDRIFHFPVLAQLNLLTIQDRYSTLFRSYHQHLWFHSIRSDLRHHFQSQYQGFQIRILLRMVGL